MQTLAKSATTHIQRCLHCNCVAVHVGPVTLRFDPGAVESLWNTLGLALTRLERELDEPSATVLGYKPTGRA